MKYKLKDGGEIIASTPQEFVTKLRESSRFDNQCTDEQYMKNFAGRFKIQSGIDVNTSSPEKFFDDLRKAEFVVFVS